MNFWNSDKLPIRLAKMVFGLILTAAIALLWPTIVFSFPQKHDAPNATALVRSCEDTGPITRRGYGHNWNCTAEIRDSKTGETWTTDLDMNFFTPDDIGKEKELTWGYGGGRYNINTEKRTYTPAEGYSSGTFTVVACVAGILVLPGVILMLVTALAWSLKSDEHRKHWEKIRGTPEERAAKKQQEQERDADWRDSQQRIAELRRANKERRREGR
jgi:hypothetical protein